MSLFRPRKTGAGVPADRPETRLTVRLPKRLDGARIVSVHGGYGDAVHQGAAVLTLRHGEERHVLKAPRAGQLLPIAAAGDELAAGDALFALHFETEADDALARLRNALPRHDAVRRLPSSPAAEPHCGQRLAGDDAAVDRPLSTPVPIADDADRLRDRVALLHQDPAANIRPGLASQLLRGAAAWLLCVAGAVAALPVIAEFGFAGPVGARLSVMVAALTLGLLLWRWLARGTGWSGQLLVGSAGATWAALVVLTLAATNPFPLGPIALERGHALELPDRVRVSPPRPSAMLPNTVPGVAEDGDAGARPTAGPPREGIRFSARPVEDFALGRTPDHPPGIAARQTLPLASPGGREASGEPASPGLDVPFTAAPAPSKLAAPAPPGATEAEGIAALRAAAPARRPLQNAPQLPAGDPGPAPKLDTSLTGADRAPGTVTRMPLQPAETSGIAQGLAAPPAPAVRHGQAARPAPAYSDPGATALVPAEGLSPPRRPADSRLPSALAAPLGSSEPSRTKPDIGG